MSQMMKANNTRSSYNDPTFKPFQSGCSLCYPSIDYRFSNTMKGGSQQKLISNLSGKNLYKTTNYSVPMNKLMKDNYGISFNTSGGAKKSRNSLEKKVSHMMKFVNKRGGDNCSAVQSEDSTMTGGKKTRVRSKKKKGGMASEMVPTEENSMMTGGKKTRTRKIKSRSRSTTRGRKLKGGEETWGATGMPAQFFNANAKLMGYPYNSGYGVKTAYGLANPKDVGMGLLAPNTTSNASTANPSTSMKTGGRKKTKKQSGKGFPIPTLSSIPIDVVQVNVDKGISDVQTFLKDLKRDYVKSVQKAASIKIGNQRLIQGGAKSRTTKKKVTKKDAKKDMKKKDTKKDTKKLKKKDMKKKDTKKVIKKSNKKIIKKKKGGDGSDFISTFNSRGPSNAPDTYWGVNGEKWFRQFNKSANYIPNSQLAKAATPKLLAGPMNEKVVGYNSFESTFSPIRGGKKIVTKKKKVVKKDTKKTTKKDIKKTTKKDTKKTTKKKDTKKKITSKK